MAASCGGPTVGGNILCRSGKFDVRATHEWYGDFRKGQLVADAYFEILGKVIP